MSDQNGSTNEIVRDIMGFGEVIRVLCGHKNEGDKLVPDVRNIHITPVGLKDVPALQILMKKFSDLTTGQTQWGEDSKIVAVDIIYMSTRKMHPDLTKEQIADWFSLGALAKVIALAMDLNDFLSHMGKMVQSLPQEVKQIIAQAKVKEVQ